jgi:hypothetical protein
MSNVEYFPISKDKSFSHFEQDSQYKFSFGMDRKMSRKSEDFHLDCSEKIDFSSKDLLPKTGFLN